MKLSRICAEIVVLLGAMGLVGAVSRADAVEEPVPIIDREFRAVWVATVDNIDWPSRPGLSADQQRSELVEIFDTAAKLNFNAVVLQVRPAADALYASDLEPWSPYLTGEMGQPPQPAYDPLEFAVRQAHERGIELHAWFNPYRALHPSWTGDVSPNHISRTHPEIVRTYGKYGWLDPAEPQAARHSLRVILDVVQRYDIDGVHLDDYFYPYPIRDEEGQEVPFPDDVRWQNEKNEWKSQGDWRRHHIDQFVQDLYREVKSAKRWVKVGISPFGIWRPGHPPSIKGFDAYDKLYADARKWFHEGWVDYLTPQLYWSIDSEGQSYPALLKWWSMENLQQRHLWPGNYLSKLGMGEKGWPVSEIERQIAVTRAHPRATGNVFFSMKALMRNEQNVQQRLLAGPYAAPALVPATPWLGQAPDKPLEWEQAADGRLSITTPLKDEFGWVVWQSYDGRTWQTQILPASERTLRPVSGTQQAAVTYVNRLGLASPKSVLRLKD